MANPTHTDHPATQRYLASRAQVIALQAEVSRLEQEVEAWRLKLAYQCIEVQEILNIIQVAIDDLDTYPLHAMRQFLLPLLKVRLEKVVEG